MNPFDYILKLIQKEKDRETQELEELEKSYFEIQKLSRQDQLTNKLLEIGSWGKR